MSYIHAFGSKIVESNEVWGSQLAWCKWYAGTPIGSCQDPVCFTMLSGRPYPRWTRTLLPLANYVRIAIISCWYRPFSHLSSQPGGDCQVVNSVDPWCSGGCGLSPPTYSPIPLQFVTNTLIHEPNETVKGPVLCMIPSATFSRSQIRVHFSHVNDTYGSRVALNAGANSPTTSRYDRY